MAQMRSFLAVILFLFPMLLHGQMVVGSDTLVGDEWIRYDASYARFTVSTDGVCRISQPALLAAGFESGQLTADAIRLYSMGQEIPLYISTNGLLGPDDYVEFYGRRNRGEMDRFLFRLPDNDMLDPDYSLYTDERPYFLTLRTDGTPMRVQPVDVTSGTNLPYHIHQEVVEYHNTINDPYYPLPGSGAISYSSYMHGEGFAKSSETSSTTAIQALSRTPDEPQANLHIRFATTNYGTHRYVVMWNGNSLDTIRPRDITIVDTTYLLPGEWLADDNQLTLTSLNTQSRHALVRIELTYARLNSLPSVEEVHVTIPASDEDTRIDLDGFLHGDAEPIVYSTDGTRRSLAEITGPQSIQVRWPAALASTELSVSSAVTRIQWIDAITPVSFSDLRGDDTEYIVITHPDLMPAGTSGEYIQYRSSPEGGSYRARAFSILDLYDQFGYGIQKHPQAIRNFVEFVSRHWPSAKMFFIIGRGIEYNRSRLPGESWENAFFVPTFGRPGSDQLLMATLWDLIPRYPVGRLAVTDPEGISNYLEKVRAHDMSLQGEQSLAGKRWIKNVMHIGGGKTSSEQSAFETTLEELGDRIAWSDYGANVSFFQKTSTDIIGESQSARILELLREGCGIINYLGHSGSSTFEFNISEPAEWNNTGRYPVFSAMGCSAGQIHGPLMSLSDNYVQIPGEGAIAFISGSGSQYAAALTEWARPWYDFIGQVGYGEPLGDATLYGLQALDKFVDPALTNANQYRFLLEQQTLQGDPAIRFHPLPGPDYLPDQRAVQIEPGVLSTDLDSFDLTYSVFNIGRNTRDTVAVRISIQQSGAPETELLRDTLACDRYESQHQVRLPLATGGKAGAFRLLIRVDPDDRIEELPAPAAEENNDLVDNLGREGIELYVSDNRTAAVYPADFAIVNDLVPEMTAAGTNAFAAGAHVVFELDTNGRFDSPMRIRDRFLAPATTVKWSPDITWTPGTVYYWRVSSDSLSTEQSFVWDRRSFIYLPDSPDGWNQSHFHQWTDNTLEQLTADSLAYTFRFGTRTRDFRILNRYHDLNVGLIPQVVLDGVIKAEFFTGFRTQPINVFVVAIDSLTGEFMLNPNPGLYGSWNPLSFDAPCFAYRTDTPESRQALIDFVENVIPSGHYVFFYTYQRTPYPDYFPEQWASDEGAFGKSIFTLIEDQVPTSAIRTLENTGSVPYIILFRKDRGGIQELIARDTTEVISMIPDLRSSLAMGTMTTPPIGPAVDWQEILWRPAVPSDTTGMDQVAAWVYTEDFQDSILVAGHLPLDTVLTPGALEAFPFLRLTLDTRDTAMYDPLDLAYWRVLYTGLPELVIRPDLGFVFQADTLFQGDTFRLTTMVENITRYAADSVPILLRLTDAGNVSTELWTMLPSIPGHSVVPVSFSRSTIDLAGDYQVLMQVNPGRAVPELDLSNNTGLLRMHVREDDLNPILEVTFDGFRILDGDLVSSRPDILATLTDDNGLKRLTDTSTFEIYLQFPSDFEPRRIWFSEPILDFIPATATGPNVARALLRPDLLEEGYYTLLVNARDASGNAAGNTDYTVSFRVDHTEAISYLQAWPNPFRHMTYFVYSLSGMGNPPDYHIEIVNSSGILVREIDRDELGPLPAGTHPVQYAWDGSDADGSPLPSGMYFFRMIVRDASRQAYALLPSTLNTGASRQGWGKVILIR